MADEKKQLSLSDLCQSLVDEFAATLVMVKRSHPTVLVRSVKLKLGQAKAPVAAENLSPLILKERYPGSEKGWQLQLELGERSAATIEGVQRPLVHPYAPTALDLVAEYPLTVIDGINTKWSQLFAEFDLTRVRHLARLDESELHKIIDHSRSLLVREFRQKVLLLQLPVPALPHSSLHELSLYKVLRLTTNELHEGFGKQRVSLSQITSLFEVLDILNIVIDTNILKKIPLRQLLDS